MSLAAAATYAELERLKAMAGETGCRITRLLMMADSYEEGR